MHLAFVTASRRVLIGSIEHLVPIIISIIFAFFLIRYASRKNNDVIKFKLFNCLGVFISISVISFHFYYAIFGSYNIKTDLPLYLCSLIAVIIPIFTFTRKYWMFEILFFWIIVGTLQGIITPDIAVGFPSLDYFRYWIVHLGLFSLIFYAILVLKMRPKFNSTFKSFFALQMYVLLMITVNFVLDANYFYLNEKPQSASVLDYFGEWPFYIIIVQIIIIPLFFIVFFLFNFSLKYLKSRKF